MAAISWKNPVSGDWDVATNWSTDTVPTSADDVTISASGAYTVTVSGADAANSLTFSAPSASLVENAGSLTIAGSLTLDSGLVSLNEANTIGSIDISGGVLALGDAGAPGAGAVSMTGGEILGAARETITNPIALSTSGNTITFAAADATAVKLSGPVSISDGDTLDIGAPGQDGRVVWLGVPSGSTTDVSVDVKDGTLAAGNSNLMLLTSAFASTTTIEAGATLDWNNNAAAIANLRGAGIVLDNAAQTMDLEGSTSFSGEISGALSVDFGGNASLSGLENFTGDADLETNVLTNSGVYDLVTNSNVFGAPSSSFINSGVFEKTNGGGVSDVTTNFVNNGALNVLSGSVTYSGGFTNNGVIHGLVTETGGVTTVSAAVPSGFTGNGHSDILWQNTSGQAAIWTMNGTALTGGGPVSPNPGPNWKAVGTGDFNGDGLADILWQNVNGQASIWEMNRGAVIGGGPVSPNPGPAWKAVGTGDFNGDGLADILWWNTKTGQASIWEMNGNTVIGGGLVSPGPGPGWEAVGTGDFDGDGRSDIVWRNVEGQVAIWQMNGTQVIGAGIETQNPGSNWRFVGTGDFNQDGCADIVFQNRNSGQVSIWEMGGTGLNGGGPVSANPGANWRAVGVGDYYGGGRSDILFQNTSGQASIWEMNGTNIVAGGPVNPNPGPSWHAIHT
jgi:hypothetical protein